MPARNVAGGTALAGSLTVNATISAGVVVHQGSVAFAGAGSLVTNSIQRLNSTTAFAGAGGLVTNAALIQPAIATFAGVGGFTAAGTTSKEPLGASAAFAGAGSLTATTLHFSAGVYDETGAATLTIAANAFSELEFGLKLDDSLQTGDTLTFRVYLDGQPLATYSVTPSITVAAHAISATAAWAGIGGFAADATVLRGPLQVSALLAGAGQLSITPRLLMVASANLAGAGSLSVSATQLGRIEGSALLQGAGALTVATRQWLAASAVYGGIGSLSISQSRLNMLARATFGGAGSLFAELTPPTTLWPGQAQFDGLGDLSAIANLSLPSAIQMDGVGNFTADAMRFIPLSETFSGAGSFLVGDVQLLLAGLANYGAVGSLSVYTTMTSARAEWLVCASISIAPELPVAVTLNPEMAADPSMKVC